MSNILEKDTIGEHEGWLNNPFLTFFVGILLLSLFSIMGTRFHDVSLATEKDDMARDQRFEKIKTWRSQMRKILQCLPRYLTQLTKVM